MAPMAAPAAAPTGPPTAAPTIVPATIWALAATGSMRAPRMTPAVRTRVFITFSFRSAGDRYGHRAPVIYLAAGRMLGRVKPSKGRQRFPKRKICWPLNADACARRAGGAQGEAFGL